MKINNKTFTEQLNVPEAVSHLGRNALDSKNKPAIRYNYIQTLKIIRDYCNNIISDYEKTDDGITRKTRIRL